VVDEPVQIAILEPALIAGKLFTVTVFAAVLLQPEALVPVTVYVVVIEGVAVTLAPLVAESPVAGNQE
jgi:hypothetical protein